MRTITFAAALLATPLMADSFGLGFSGYSLTPVFQNKVDSPSSPFIPVSYGGISARPGEPDQLIVGGGGEGSGAAFFKVGVMRDVGGHISGLNGSKSVYATAPKLAGGAAFGPSFNAGEVFFYSIASGSGGVDVGMIRWGSSSTGKTINIVPETPGGLGFVPPGFRGFPQMKILTASGRFYSVKLQADAEGTYDLAGAELSATLPVGSVQSFVYIKAGSPGFAADSMLVAEYATGNIAAYEIDGTGTPRPATRRTFFSGASLSHPEGMTIDPLTADLLITTYSSSTSGIYRISGFIPPAAIPVTGCQSITAPGNYQLTQNIGPANGVPCIQIHDTSNVHLACGGHTLTGYITVANTTDFSIRDCVLPSHSAPGVLDESRPIHLTIANSSNGLISHNQIGTQRSQWFFVRFNNVQGLNVVDNQIYAFFSLDGATGTAVRFNRSATPSTYIGGDLIAFASGANNVIDTNRIDGVNIESEGQTIAIGLQHETNDTVSNNETFCAPFCIYLVDVAGSKVNANRTRGGFAAWEGHRVTDVVWSNNTAENVYSTFYLTEALRNTLYRNTTSDTGATAYVTSVVTPAGQNLIKENYFGHAEQAPFHGNPDFGTLPVPPGAIIDGGGNTCRPAPGLYPLVCR